MLGHTSKIFLCVFVINLVDCVYLCLVPLFNFNSHVVKLQGFLVPVHVSAF